MKDEKTGDDLVSIGFVIDLEYADATTSAHDLLQQFKTHPLVREILEGGERVGWGAKALPAGGYWSMPKLSMPGARARRRRAAAWSTPAALKGVHHAIKSGMLAAEAIYARAEGRQHRLLRLRGRGRGVADRQGALRGAQHAPAVPEGLHQRRPAGEPDDRHQGPASRAGAGRWHRNDAKPMFVGKTKKGYPEARRQVHLRQALERLHHAATRRATTRRTTSACRSNVPREIAETWQWMCPAGRLRDPRGRARGRATST